MEEYLPPNLKAYNMTDHPKHGYSPTDLINELALLAFMVVVEAARLVLGNKHDLVRIWFPFDQQDFIWDFTLLGRI